MRTAVLWVLVAVTGACASSTTLRAPTMASSSSEATGPTSRCAAVADSVRAVTPVTELPYAAPRTRPRLPMSRNAPAGEVHTSFLVDPNGRAVPSTIVTRGGGYEYQTKMAEVVMRAMFRPPTVAGCPSWGRGDIRLRTEIRGR